jgi:hypothetical protein
MVNRLILGNEAGGVLGHRTKIFLIIVIARVKASATD